MARNIIVAESVGTGIEDRAVEIVERKGIGHPDSLCDGIAERVSVEYTRWCKENLGRELHHNFDKVQLVAGEVDVTYGHGEVLKPILIQLAGRGTPEVQLEDGTVKKVPMDQIAVKAAKAHIRETMKYLDPDEHCVIKSYAGKGASELMSAVHQITANDTSFGVSHWPHSGLEAAVYDTAQYINYDLLKQFPIGEDVKVMGARMGNEVILTCAIPFIAPELSDFTEYEESRNAVHAAVQEYAAKLNPKRSTTVHVNTADHASEGDAFLTVTGTSAENGDDGAVGRGNRINGVIAPFRSTSLEAAAGKNPISHVGKIYNVLALLAAQDIIEQVPEIGEAQVYILSQIGHPLDQPLVATASVRAKDGSLSEAATKKVTDIIDGRLSNMDDVRTLLAAQEIKLH